MERATEYHDQQRLERETRSLKTLCRPSVLVARLAIAGRLIVGPLALLLLFTATGYLTDASVLVEVDESFVSFTERDLAKAGGCAQCVGACKITLLMFGLFSGEALVSAPRFRAVTSLPPTESLYDFRTLSKEVLDLGETLDAASTQILNVVATLNISVSPQLIRELEVSIGQPDGCKPPWTLCSIYPGKFSKISAATVNLYPEFTECRPDVPNDGNLVGKRLASDTNGNDVLEAVPDALKIYPYSFSSSLRPISRAVPATNTKYGATTVLEPLLNAYYGGCRVREVNITGIYVEDTCEASKHWSSYGLMVQSPDDIPLCIAGDVCIHNYFNTQWEGIVELTPENRDHVPLYVNSVRSRYGDTVPINTLPGVVVAQILFMGIVSLYEVVSHQQSVLLSQIWAYRCQIGRVQVLYLAQITYHLVYNSDLYLLGLATGTLTGESIANLTLCFFAFSYSFVNLAKARSGEQRLDRRLRLKWEAMQFVITICVGSLLRSIQQTPIIAIITQNAEILLKTSARGARYCGLHDTCILFTVSTALIVLIFSAAFAVVVSLISYANAKLMKDRVAHNLTSFERNCIGAPFRRLFRDCDDIAHVTYKGKRCTTVEALLLAGYLYYGEHVYKSSSVMMLLLARVVPTKIIRTFNVLLLRWHMDPVNGTLTQAYSCTWYHASQENHKLHGAMPVA
ncbi:hypothetical protein PHYSODRAFT_318879 [Phytophthora sojae]|uniref:Uncharacterized protein n=1 Tax=Phytophthora sojae (strain P6497) TaxID=1094619 RepID=G5A785_PHYSP|nr:hypothetical protein PHYSODRAFT_318879 [Phytophthora sojae]EGZ09190.1 hypothetical protein PHYSODRAFT_318879 [Phytophthora sojae]|eukprot:XP_009535823.1 hypothetical protein PHYSODRAFT_318879 [Phytophthora sojae]